MSSGRRQTGHESKRLTTLAPHCSQASSEISMRPEQTGHSVNIFLSAMSYSIVVIDFVKHNL
jgi:hypothetical protein